MNPQSLRQLLRALLTLSAILACISLAADEDSDRCKARLEVKLTPGIPNPRDPSFLSALAAHPLYILKWVSGSGSTAVLDLTGPVTDYRCEHGVARISRDARVLDLKVLPPDSEPLATSSGA